MSIRDQNDHAAFRVCTNNCRFSYTFAVLLLLFIQFCSLHINNMNNIGKIFIDVTKQTNKQKENMSTLKFTLMLFHQSPFYNQSNRLIHSCNLHFIYTQAYFFPLQIVGATFNLVILSDCRRFWNIKDWIGLIPYSIT